MRMSIAEWSDIESERMNCPVVKMKRVMMRTSLLGARLCRVERSCRVVGKKQWIIHKHFLKNPFIILA